MENKDCMFQYASDREVFFDTDLITREEATRLFAENKEDFTKRLRLGESPEMAIWINCKDNTSYGDTSHYWCGDNMIVVEGKLYTEV